MAVFGSVYDYCPCRVEGYAWQTEFGEVFSSGEDVAVDSAFLNEVARDSCGFLEVPVGFR